MKARLNRTARVGGVALLTGVSFLVMLVAFSPKSKKERKAHVAARALRQLKYEQMRERYTTLSTE